MDVVFGLWADAGAAPDHGGGGAGALGAPVVGPSGFLDILETIYGLGAPHVAQVVRIASFQAALEHLEGDRFWSRSLAMDPWATSRTLLQWRDRLVELGWKPDGGWQSRRLADLAAAEGAAADLPPGIADRTTALLQVLETAVSPPVRRVRLIDRRDIHPSRTRQLLDRLEQLGTAVVEIAPAPAAPEDTALGRMQRWLLAGGEVTGSRDGTLTVATSTSSVLAAEVVGQWFAAGGGHDAVLIAQEADTDLLDHGLRGVGQPRAGRSRPSPHRGSLQLLLLAFKSVWTPFEPRALMELLVFPRAPIPPRAAWRLAEALEEAPGRGGPAWLDAWAAIEVTEFERAGDQPADRRKARSRIAAWRSWAEPETADPVAGIPLAQALAICERTSAWATARHAADNDPLYLATATLSADVRRAVASLGRTHLPRILVERIIDQALDIGHANPSAGAEAARWRCVPHPGGLWGPAPAVVWWNFRSTTEGADRAPWTSAECQELAVRGCPPDDIGIESRSASAAWERAVLNASGHLVLVAAGLDCEAEDALHPLAHRIAPALERLGDRVRIEDVLSTANLDLAGAQIPREQVMHAPLPVARAVWMTPAGFAVRVANVTESATSLESVLSCQLMWALRHVARLRPGRVRSIPDANQLLGNLAHAIAREVFLPGTPPDPQAAGELTRMILEERIDQLAAPLRHPEFAEELTFARRRLPEAMAGLAQTLRDNALAIEATEWPASMVFDGTLAVRGKIDLLARDANGSAVVIDLKWTRSGRARIAELREGNAVQLATYGALVAPDTAYRAGYYLLNQRQFATLADSGLIGRPVEGTRSFRDTWTATVDAWGRWRSTAHAGTLVALGVEGCEEHVPPGLAITREVKCEWCEYATVCRLRGLH